MTFRPFAARDIRKRRYSASRRRARAGITPASPHCKLYFNTLKKPCQATRFFLSIFLKITAMQIAFAMKAKIHEIG